MEKNNDPIREVFFFLKKDNAQEKKHLKNTKQLDQHFKIDIYFNSDKVDLERKVTPTWQALSNTLGCHLGNTVSGATQAIRRSGYEADRDLKEAGYLALQLVKVFLRHQLLPRGSESLKQHQSGGQTTLGQHWEEGEKYCQKQIEI